MSEADKDWDEAPKLPKAAKPRGRTNWWRWLALVLLPYAVFSWYSDPFTLEYYGYCKKDGVTREPQALMDAYIQKTVLDQVKRDDGYIRYDSVLDFYQKNPGCCTMYAWKSPQEGSWAQQRFWKLFDRIFFSGEYYRVWLAYRSRIDDEAPYVRYILYINSCGEVADKFGGSTKSYEPLSGVFPRFITGHPR